MLVFVVSPASVAQKEAAARGEGCLGCHKSIEVINYKMALAWGADKKCEVCHYGQPSAATELEAHVGLIANPGDLRVIERTCGKCHSDYGEIQKLTVEGVDNHVGKVVRSLMATAAGEIAGTRYLWNQQSTRSGIFGVRAVSDLDRNQPEGAVARLQELPPASNSDPDSLLRGACLRCHLWTEDKQTPGIYRPAGCSACHVLYEKDGLSRSADTTVPKDEPGHPAYHVITTKVPTSQCLWCHNDGGGRVGLSYVGLAVTASALSPQQVPQPAPQNAYGASLMHVRPDIHYRRGMDCIDCHDTLDLHGDGNMYSHQEYQVGIRCETCHGSSTRPPSFRTERGNLLRNVEVEQGQPLLRTKLYRERHLIPLLYDGQNDSSALPDIWHKGHERLECYACHSASVPQCYVCHMVRDDRQMSPVDWGVGMGEQQAVRPSTGSWIGRKLFQLWDDAVLGINRRGRVAPFTPGGQAVLDHIDHEGEEVKRNHTFTTAAGLYGFSMSPVQPHTVDTESRTCSSCHSSPKALGLGTEGFVDPKRFGLPFSFPPDKLIDGEGARIQDSAREGVRPFTSEELTLVFKSETCIDCHQTPPEHTAVAPEPSASPRAADRLHHKAIQEMLHVQEEE